MLDLGTLGGTSGTPSWLNDRGQVVGSSNLAGDATQHAFLWDRGILRDLGTLGGSNSEAFFVNEAGDVVGKADVSLSDPHHHAFLWKNGVMTDLGTVDGGPSSTAFSINAQDQVVGVGSGEHGWLWENGVIHDLNTLVLPGSDLSVSVAAFINDRGEIYGTGTLPKGDQHVILLVPTDLAASEGLLSHAPASSTTGPPAATHGSPMGCSSEPAWRAFQAHRSHRPCLGA
jgi:probable HAF family extracellular repeat protein